MSNIYIQEPGTTGKVILNTSVGSIEVELWSREAPEACRNFLQLCAEGYYDGTIFHRIIKGFIAQGGDPTGTGTGGESIYSRQGKPWRDEFHSRLRFVRRGLVAAADKGSQFFFTLGEARELQGKHTIFGKVAGDTMYNMVRLEECVVDREGRPEFPQKVISCKIVDNPFPDLDVEGIVAKRMAAEVEKEKEEKGSKSKKKGNKNFKLLSFGDEAEAEEAENISVAHKAKSKSFHDFSDDPNMVSATVLSKSGHNHSSEKPEPLAGDAIEVDIPVIKQEPDIDVKIEEDEEESFEAEMRDKVRRKLEKAAKEKFGDKGRSRWDVKEKKEVKIEKQVKAEVPRVEKTAEKDAGDEYSQVKSAKKGLESRARQPKGSSREAETLKLLEKFKSKLASVSDEPVENEQEDEDVKGIGWMAHELKFSTKDPELAKDASTKGDDWYDVFDPRNPVNKRRRENAAREEKGKKRHKR